MTAHMTDEQLVDLLADPSLWAEPRASLEDSIVQAVMNDEPVVSSVTSLDEHRRRRHRRWIVAPAAAAAAAAAIFGLMVTASGPAGPAFTAELSPTAAVAGAHGTARITRNAGGFRVALDAAGLSPLADGQFYEAWLKDDAGTLVPIGTFSSTDDDVTLWSGVSPDRFATFTVTIETPDNDQASSGRVVLHGAIRPG